MYHWNTSSFRATAFLVRAFLINLGNLQISSCPLDDMNSAVSQDRLADFSHLSKTFSQQTCIKPWMQVLIDSLPFGISQSYDLAFMISRKSNAAACGI